VQAANAARAARRAHTGGPQPTGERFPPLRQIMRRDTGRWSVYF
jgi:hypothetical protein